MNFSEAIAAAYKRALEEHVKYPRLAALLRTAGVRYYVVDTATGTTTYYGASADVHSGASQQTVGNTFARAQILAALKDTQTGKTTYAQFMVAIAAAGVQTYLADLEHMRVIYIGHGEAYEEAIPQ